MLVYFIGLGVFLGLSLIGLVLFILKNRKEIDKEIAMNTSVKHSKNNTSQPYMPELGWY